MNLKGHSAEVSWCTAIKSGDSSEIDMCLFVCLFFKCNNNNCNRGRELLTLWGKKKRKKKAHWILHFPWCNWEFSLILHRLPHDWVLKAENYESIFCTSGSSGFLRLFGVDFWTDARTKAWIGHSIPHVYIMKRLHVFKKAIAKLN